MTRWLCDHCSRGHWKRADAASHERHCWANPNRVPRLGEITACRGEWGDGDGWYEPLNWVPRRPVAGQPDEPGMIHVGKGRWVKVPGHCVEYIPSKPGDHTIGGHPVDLWPIVDGYPFDKIPHLARLDYLDLWTAQ